MRACDNVKDAAALATDELLGAGATAVFACNYYLELGALKSMLRRSLRPGIDVGFAGFDEIDFADIFDPVPTCVIQPIVAIASLAASLLVGRIGRGFAPDGIHRLACEVRITESVLGGLPA